MNLAMWVIPVLTPSVLMAVLDMADVLISNADVIQAGNM